MQGVRYLRQVEALYEALLKEEIVRVRESPPFFQWASGLLSPIYIDFRKCLAHPALRKALLSHLLDRINEREITFAGIAGVATGGISWAAWLAEKLDLPMGYVRSTPKSHGTKQLVEALSPHHSPLLLIEDVLSTGQSVATAIAHLQNEGFTLAAIAVLWNYALPGRQYEFPYPLYEVLRFPQALKVWEPHLSSSQYHILEKWYETAELPA